MAIFWLIMFIISYTLFLVICFHHYISIIVYQKGFIHKNKTYTVTEKNNKGV
jgi:hypothetical protein